jgi:hypothetical protein
VEPFQWAMSDPSKAQNRPNSTASSIFHGVPLTSLLVRLLTAGLGYIALVTAS